jgi:hypothetical protein
MKHKASMVLVMFAVWSVACSIQAADTRPYPTARVNTPVDDETFRTLDMNGDGYVSRSEVRRGTRLEQQFDQLDTNRDGRLSREELRGMFAVEQPGDATNRRYAPQGSGDAGSRR